MSKKYYRCYQSIHFTDVRKTFFSGKVFVVENEEVFEFNPHQNKLVKVSDEGKWVEDTLFSKDFVTEVAKKDYDNFVEYSNHNLRNKVAKRTTTSYQKISNTVSTRQNHKPVNPNKANARPLSAPYVDKSTKSLAPQARVDVPTKRVANVETPDYGRLDNSKKGHIVDIKSENRFSLVDVPEKSKSNKIDFNSLYKKSGHDGQSIPVEKIEVEVQDKGSLEEFKEQWENYLKLKKSDKLEFISNIIHASVINYFIKKTKELLEEDSGLSKNIRRMHEKLLGELERQLRLPRKEVS